jgi:sugar phosphate permease
VFYGWINVGILWLGYALIPAPVYYGFGSMVGPMAKGLGITLAQAGLGFTVWQLFTGLSSPIVALALNRFGSRLTIFFGAITFIIVGLLMGFLVNNFIFYCIVMGLAGFGCALSAPMAAQTMISFWFVRKRATAMSVAMTGGGFGAMIFSPLIAKVVAGSPMWQTPWFYIAVLSAIGGLVVLVCTRNRPSDMGLLSDGDKPFEAAKSEKPILRKTRVYKTSDSWEARSAFRSRVFYLITVGGITVFYGVGSVASLGVTYFTSVGIEKVIAAAAIGLFGLMSIGGRLSSGILCDIVEPRYIYAGGFLIQAIAVAILLTASNTIITYTSSMLFGIAFGLTYICMPNLIVNYFGVKNFATINSVLMTLTLSVGSFAPFITGVIVEGTKSFTYAWIVVLLMSLASCSCALFAVPPCWTLEKARGVR